MACSLVDKYECPTAKLHGVTFQTIIIALRDSDSWAHKQAQWNTSWRHYFKSFFSKNRTCQKTSKATLFISLSLRLDILWAPLILRSTFHHFIFRYSITETDTIFLRLAAGRHHEMEPCYKKLLRPLGGRKNLGRQSGCEGGCIKTSALGHVHDMCIQRVRSSSVSPGKGSSSNTRNTGTPWHGLTMISVVPIWLLWHTCSIPCSFKGNIINLLNLDIYKSNIKSSVPL
jgi:hypothetical protein